MNSMKQTYSEANPNVESLVKEHMELVRKIAWHMHGRVRNAVEIDDLLQVGYFGLVNAAQKYSKKEGAMFSSYAVIRIRGAIVDYLRKALTFVEQQFKCSRNQKSRRTFAFRIAKRSNK